VVVCKVAPVLVSESTLAPACTVVVLADTVEPTVTVCAAATLPTLMVRALALEPMLIVPDAPVLSANVPVRAVPPMVILVAVLVPILSPPEMESKSGAMKLVLARPVPEIWKLAVCAVEFWFKIPLPSAPAYCQTSPPFALLPSLSLQIIVAVVPWFNVVLSKVKLVVPVLDIYTNLPIVVFVGLGIVSVCPAVVCLIDIDV